MTNLFTSFLSLFCIANVFSTPINLVNYKTSHNSYYFKSSIEKQLTYYKFKAIELDIRKSKKGVNTHNDWWVYHDPIWSYSNVDSLRSALRTIRGVVTSSKDFKASPLFLFLDIKRLPFEDRDSKIIQLEEMFYQELGQNFFTYKDYLKRCNGLKNMLTALAVCGWPHESDLRRRVLVFLSEGADHYFFNMKRQAFFMASKLHQLNHHTAVLNFPLSKITKFQSVKNSKRYLKRVYIIKNLNDFNKARKYKEVNFIAIDENLKSY